MTARDTQQKIESYGKGYEILVRKLESFPRQMWTYRSGPHDWTIHEIIIHIADSEANSYIRGRKAIAEPGSLVTAYDEAGWARGLRYHDQSPEDALSLFRSLRASTYRLIQSLPESTWTHTIEHPENGTMTLADWLDVYEDHVPAHIAQMQGIYEEWLAHLDQHGQ